MSFKIRVSAGHMGEELHQTCANGGRIRKGLVKIFDFLTKTTAGSWLLGDSLCRGRRLHTAQELNSSHYVCQMSFPLQAIKSTVYTYTVYDMYFWLPDCLFFYMFFCFSTEQPNYLRE